MATKSPEGPPPTPSIANTITSRVHNLGSSLAGAGSAATARLRTGFTQVSTQMYLVTSAQTRSKTILLSLGATAVLATIVTICVVSTSSEVESQVTNPAFFPEEWPDEKIQVSVRGKRNPQAFSKTPFVLQENRHFSKFKINNFLFTEIYIPPPSWNFIIINSFQSLYINPFPSYFVNLIPFIQVTLQSN
ncbi:uncharacterized protein LOC111710369 [Eurytemora carolleeae]|uniref:uncharacterized protein LOC111710369 n=1 Tax=Eurytemora carolleeae TaxID=1294199 RepID=UPI000C76B4E7|nr:uncharacterized protein LOC111710369 [Eurytemora carolleeae]|eukprot:XP_023340210.1 uncharacterized protein LOC111710369 [Eurytemora affinis]